MLLEISMPAFISSAILPRHNTPRRVLAFLPTVVTLSEATEISFPLVARGTYRDGDPHDIRMIGGLFYRKLRVLTGDTLERSLIGHFWRETFVAQARRALPRLGDVLPRGAAWNIIKNNKTAKTVPHLTRIGKTMRLTEQGELDLAQARADFDDVLSKAVMFGGECWVPGPEPMLSVAHWTDRPMTMDTDSHFSGDQMRRLFNECFLGRTLYTLKQLAEAISADIASPGDRDGVTMEVFDPSVFSDEVPVGEVVALLWYIAERKDIPKPGRRRLLAFVRDEIGWTWERVAREIDYVLSSISVETRDRQMLEFHLARIDLRPISLEPHLRPNVKIAGR